MGHRLAKLLFIMCGGWALMTSSAVASDGDAGFQNRPPPALEKGMLSSDVIQQWGPTLDKVEYESKREERWNYGAAHVLFYQARVRSWDNGLNENGMKVNGFKALVKSNPSEIQRQHKNDRQYSSSPQARELLGDILREIPSGQPDSSPSPTGSVSGAEIKPMQPGGSLMPPDIE